jgi:hypothetical protein
MKKRKKEFFLNGDIGVFSPDSSGKIAIKSVELVKINLGLPD